MKRLPRLLTAILIFLTAQTLLHAKMTAEAEYLKGLVDTKVHYITDVLNNASIEKPDKIKKILTVAEEMIDFDIMAKLSLGQKEWTEMDTQQRKEFISLFSEHIKNSYIEKLFLYNGQQVRINDAEQTKATRIEVPTFILADDGETEILYKFYRTKADKWFIYDIEIAGVSIVQSNRAQFAEYLKSASIADLIEKLRKNQSL